MFNMMLYRVFLGGRGGFGLLLLILMCLLVFSIKDMNVKDPMPNAKAPIIVTKVEKHKDIVLLDVSCFVCM